MSIHKEKLKGLDSIDFEQANKNNGPKPAIFFLLLLIGFVFDFLLGLRFFLDHLRRFDTSDSIVIELGDRKHRLSVVA